MSNESPGMAFISYERPLRSNETLSAIGATLAVGVATAGIAAQRMFTSSKSPTIAGICLTVAIVAFVICGQLVWSYISNAVHRVHLTHEGIEYDGRHWPWDSVTSIQRDRFASGLPTRLSIKVNQGVLRSALTLPIQVEETPTDIPTERLQQFLDGTQFRIPWRDKVII